MALALLFTGPVLTATLTTAGCGPLLFLPSEFSPQKVELVYVAQEDITLVRWRISSDDPANPDLSFERLGDSGAYQPIDFAQSVYPGGGAPCADGQGACFQYVVRGAYAPPGGGSPVQAVHAVQGTIPGARAKVRTVDTSVTLDSFFHTGNDVVYVTITDTVAADGPYVFARPYERTMWPTSGLCLSGSAPPGVEFSPLDATRGFPPSSALTDDGIYCVGVRPAPADAGPAVLVQKRVATLPQVAPVHVTYVPRIETSPIIYQLVLDLEVPVAERCASAINNIESLVQQSMNRAGVPVVKLPTINLAVDPSATGGGSSCAHAQAPVLPAAAMAEAVKQAVTRFPEVHQQFHFLYFNNLNAPLPPTLTSSLQSLFDNLATPPATYDLQTLSWMFNPGAAALTGPPWTLAVQRWQGTDDPDLAKILTTYVLTTLPYTSQIHDPSVPIPFFSASQLATFAGGTFKICNQNTPFETVDTAGKMPLGGGPAWPIHGDDPPGFMAYLAVPIAVPAASFVPVSVEMDLQVCTRYCSGHPYVSTAGTGLTSWSTNYLCAVTE